jgi:hypothetical protein
MISDEKKQEILEASKVWFRERIAKSHIRNTLKLKKPEELQINPFLAVYLANFLEGNSDPKSIARALLLPRVLGTSITTSFGNHIQDFTSILQGAFGSTTPGIDIEFTDQLDGHKKYCQLKLGPNTINKDDVETITNHFKKTINLARTNNLRLGMDDLIVGVIYGFPSQLSGHYKRITSQYHYPVIVGEELWHRITGDEDFYNDLIAAIASVATESNFKHEFEEVIEALAGSKEIQELAGK